uniref:Uncharacterized protein n=1 Tax=Panagrellus redivivus TaxID=6233 RepID=A0A7E4W2I0_PANRE
MPVNRTAFIDAIIFGFIIGISLLATVIYCFCLGYSYKQDRGYGPQNVAEYLPFIIECGLDMVALVIATIWYYDLNQRVSILHPNVKLICHTICVGIYIGCIAR